MRTLKNYSPSAVFFPAVAIVLTGYSAELYSGGGGGGGGDEYSDSSGGCGRRAIFEVRGGLTRRPILTAAVRQKEAAAARCYGRGE